MLAEALNLTRKTDHPPRRPSTIRTETSLDSLKSTTL